MRTRSLMLVALALVACGGHSPTEPGGSGRGAANALAFTNIQLVRSLQEGKKAGTLFISIFSSCIDQSGRVCAGGAWQYTFSDRSQGRDDRYEWFVADNGRIASSGPTPAGGPASAVDIESLLGIDSDQAVARGMLYGGARYIAAHPLASISIGYRHFASRIQCQLQYYDISPGRDGCEIVIDIDGGTGELLDSDLSCLGI